MTELDERAGTLDREAADPSDGVPSIDADESGALAIGLMIAVLTMVALMTLALIVSIP